MEEAEKSVILVSGGVDSTVLLHQLSRQGRALFALACSYGQRHSRELECARIQAGRAGACEFRIVDMGFLGGLLGSASALMTSGAPVPDLADIPQSLRDQPPTYVPNRNMLLLSVAAAYAEAIGAARVYYGAQAQDEYGYWDCTGAFLQRMNALLSLNRRRPVTVEAPLLHCSKTDNVLLGLDLGVDFSCTWSCYRGGERACGACPTCVERLNAFSNAGVPDPLRYDRPGSEEMRGAP